MKRYQRGDATVVLMVAVMAAMWLYGGHMGMMGMFGGTGHAEKPVASEPQAPVNNGQTIPPAPKDAPEHQH
ncbi:MAG: hypothetical protein WCT35_11620 [Sideroxydans sp.]|jgi:hypothetical protein